jgi:hypothetical protein
VRALAGGSRREAARQPLPAPGERGWIKMKNPNYWRRESEIEAMQKAADRRSRRIGAALVRRS